MKRVLSLILPAYLLVGIACELIALESEALSRPGIRRVQLLTDTPAIVPGEPITVGLLLEPLPEHHTYWRGPGIVGVATRMDWTLPAGFTAGEMTWQPPQQVLMAGIVANGYKGPTLILTELATPAKIDQKEITLAVRCSWMACSISCNPGIADLTLTVPVAALGKAPERDEVISARFDQVRQAAPKPAPADWSFTPRLAAPDRIEIDLVIPGLDPAAFSTLHFYCLDMQVDSDEPQKFTATDPAKGALRLTLARPEFAPKHPESIAGVLHNPGGWPGLDTEHIEFSARWPEGTFPNE